MKSIQFSAGSTGTENRPSELLPNIQMNKMINPLRSSVGTTLTLAGLVCLAMGSSSYAAGWVFQCPANVTVIAGTNDPFGNSWQLCADPIDTATPCPPDTCCPTPSSGGGGGGAGGKAGCGGGPSPDPHGRVRYDDGGGGCSPNGDGPKSDGCPCEEKPGMAFWLVTEPSVNLWLKDTPLWYAPSRGTPVTFELMYKNTPGPNNQVDTSDTTVFGFGTNWHTRWRSYLQAHDNGGSAEKYFVVLGDGTARHMRIHIPDNDTGNVLAPTNGGFVLTFPSGRRNFYGTNFSDGSTTRHFLTQAEDASSNALSFFYTYSSSVVRLTKLVDLDGRETTLEYTNSSYHPALVSRIIAPYSLTNMLTYDSKSRLTNITDVIGMRSAMSYDSSNRVSTLVTPYGTNTFSYLSGSNSVNGAWFGLRISEQSLRFHLYLRGNGPTNLFPNAAGDYASLAAMISTNSSLFATAETFDYENLHLRNSYYWGPRQYANLSSSNRSSLSAETFSMSSLTTNEYNLGWTTHWLLKGADFLGTAVSVVRDPSSESSGNSEGLVRWYDYEQKASYGRTNQGQFIQPRWVASRVGQLSWKAYTIDVGGLVALSTNVWTNWRLVQTLRNPLGKPTNIIETYGVRRLIGLATNQLDEFDIADDISDITVRTNQYTYTENNIDVSTASLTHEDQNGGLSTLQVTINSYNDDGLLSSSDDALGRQTLYAYDSSRRLIRVVHPSGLSTTNVYGGDGFLAAVIEYDASMTPLRTTSYTYTNGFVRSRVTPSGLTNTFTYDALGRLIKTAFPDNTYITNIYDKLDIVKVIDRANYVHEYQRNSFGQVLRYIDPRGKTNVYQYCDCGSLDVHKDALNNATTFTYDNAGRNTKVTFPDGSWQTLTYDPRGRVIGTSDSGGNTINFSFNSQGQQYEAANGFGKLSHTDFNARDFAVRGYDINGVTNIATFDILGRLLTRTSGAGTESFGYTNAGAQVPSGPIFYTNQIGEITQWFYDALERKKREVRYNANFVAVQTNAFAYDASGNLTNLTDGKSQATTWRYDLYGRVTNKVVAASTELFRYQYDVNGRLINRWSAGTTSAVTTVYGYDANGNLTSVDYSGSAVNPDISLTYDGNNRLVTMSDGIGTTTYAYTSFGALASEDGPWADDTVSYTYNTNRLRKGVNVLHPNNPSWSQTYGYDEMSRLTSMATPAGAFTYGYRAGSVWDDFGGQSVPTAGSLVNSLLLPGGSYTTNQFDALSRLTDTALRTSVGVTNQHQYTYNDANARTRQTRRDGSYVDYAYDALGQLTRAWGYELGGTTNRWQERFGYAYDAAGNLSYRTNHALVQAFSVNNLNQLSTVNRSGNLTVAGVTHGAATNVTVATNTSAGLAADRYGDNTFSRTNLPLANGNNTFTAVATNSAGRRDTNVTTVYLPSSASFQYDSNGNLIFDGLRGLAYDNENQLIRVTVTNSWKSEFAYDGKMRRRVRKEFSWRSGSWVMTAEVRYVYDGNLVIQERDQFNLPRVTYTRGKDLSGGLGDAGGIGGLLARTDHDALAVSDLRPSVYYSFDGNGNVTCLVDTNQTVVGRYLYDPFGNTLAATGPAAEANLYRFSSKELHVASGLVYYLYRYYDPNLQRWPNRDPLGEEGGINLYSFSDNDPIGRWDAFGLLGGGRGAGTGGPGGISPKLGGRGDGTPCPPRKRNCESEHLVCQVYTAAFAGLTGMTGKIGTGLGLIIGVGSIPTCDSLKQDCEKWNKDHGF